MVHRALTVLVVMGVALGCSEKPSPPPAGHPKPPAPRSENADADGPFVNGQRQKRVPKGYEARFKIGDKEQVLAYCQITVYGSKEEPKVQIEAVPSGKKQAEGAETELLIDWELKGTKPGTWEELQGITHTYAEGGQGAGLASLLLEGKEYSIKELKIVLLAVKADAVEVAFTGKIEGGVPLTATLKAYRGLWQLPP